MNQLSREIVDVPMAFRLLQQAEQGDDNSLRAAREGGMEARNAGIGFDECPYPADRSQRRRAVWQLSWLMHDSYLYGLHVSNRNLHPTWERPA
jgi:hypothetical protein